MIAAGGTLPDGIVLGGTFRPLFRRVPLCRYVLDEGGRGSAKSWHTALALLNLTYEPGHVILYTRWTLVSAEISIIPEFQEKIDLMDRRADFKVEAHEITNLHTGSRIIFRGIKTSQGNQTASLKSIHGVTVWVLDEAEEMTDEATFDKIDLSIRTTLLPNRVWVILNPSDDEHWIYKRWHRKPTGAVPADAPVCSTSGIKGCVHRADTTYIHARWEDNRANLSPEWITQAERMRVDNPSRYANVFGGVWSKFAMGGVLWVEGDLKRARIKAPPDGMVRVFVAVDPAVSTESTSDETGIVVVGLDRDQKVYVLEDLSGRYMPLQWAAMATQAARRWNAAGIVAEKNQGGNLVGQTIRTVDPGVTVFDVTAARDKLTRAGPVYALYQANRVFHCGEFPALERQMLAFNPDADAEHDDRVDALVWGVRKLAVDPMTAFVV